MDESPVHEPSCAEPSRLRRVSWILLEILGIALLLLSLAAWAGAWDWRLDLLAHVRIYFALPLIGVFVLGALVRRWRVLGIAGAGLALNGIPFALAACAGPAALEPGGPELVVFAHNVLTSNPHHDAVAAQIRELDPDIAILQELDPAWVESLKGELGALRPLVVRPDAKGNQGIGVWLKPQPGVELVLAEAFELGEAGQGAQSVRLKLLVKGQALEVLGTHTFPPNSFDLAPQHAAQLSDLGELAAASNGAWAVFGDLNTTPWSTHYRGLVRRGGLSNLASGLLGSWPSWRPAWRRIAIDHCLLKGPLGVSAWQQGVGAGSDHVPLIARLRLPKK